MIREADWTRDYHHLAHIGQTFLAESHQNKLTWSQGAFEQFFWGLLNDGVSKVYVATINDEAVGYAVVTVAQEVTEETVAYLRSFYVLPEYRGELHSWRLLKAVQNYAISAGCAFLYAASTAGMHDDGATLRAFRKLFEKAGMTFLGEFFKQDLMDG